MKYIKLFAVMLGLVAVTSSCKDEKDYNTATGVTVEMGETEVSVKERAGTFYFYLPINVTGTPNGDIKVKIKTEEVGNNPAKPFVEQNGSWSGNYIITSETINIPKGETTANVEISPVDDRVINDERTFLVSIESADGASIGTPSSTLVTIRDNDSNPYDRIQGEWTLCYQDFYNSASTMNVSIGGFEEDSPRYNKTLTLDGMWQAATTDGSSAQMTFVYDEVSEEAHIEFVIPQTIGTYSKETQYDIWLVPTQRYSDADGDFSLYMNTTVLYGIISDDFDTVTFDEMMGFSWYLANPADFNEQPERPLMQVATSLVLKRR